MVVGACTVYDGSPPRWLLGPRGTCKPLTMLLLPALTQCCETRALGLLTAGGGGLATVQQAKSLCCCDLCEHEHVLVSSVCLSGMCRVSHCTSRMLVGRVTCQQQGWATPESGSALVGSGSKRLSCMHVERFPLVAGVAASLMPHAVPVLPVKPARGIPTVCTSSLAHSFLHPL